MTTGKKSAKSSRKEAGEVGELREEMGIGLKYGKWEGVYVEGRGEEMGVGLGEMGQEER